MVMLMGGFIGFLHELKGNIFGKTLGESLGHWSDVSTREFYAMFGIL
jgi:hypothetical protein